MHQQLYAAFFRTKEGCSGHVTLGGQVFLANKGLMEDMVEAMSKKHPGVEFHIEEVN